MLETNLFPAQISHPSSHPPLPSAPSSTTLHPSQFSAQSSVTLTTAPKLPTQRRSLSSQRRLPLLLPLTELPLSEAPFNHTVLVLWSMLPVLSPTREPPIWDLWSSSPALPHLYVIYYGSQIQVSVLLDSLLIIHSSSPKSLPRSVLLIPLPLVPLPAVSSSNALVTFCT